MVKDYPYRWPTHRKTIPGKKLMLPDAWALAYLIRRRMLEEYAAGSFWTGPGAVCTSDLSGACAIGAVIATMVLRAHGYRAGVVAGHAASRRPWIGHMWAATSCGWHVDPTFGQYSEQWESFAEMRTRHLIPITGMPLELIARANQHVSLPGNHTATIWCTLGWFGAQTEYGRRVLGIEEEMAAA
jgi:hypothetical protein